VGGLFTETTLLRRLRELLDQQHGTRNRSDVPDGNQEFCCYHFLGPECFDEPPQTVPKHQRMSVRTGRGFHGRCCNLYSGFPVFSVSSLSLFRTKDMPLSRSSHPRLNPTPNTAVQRKKRVVRDTSGIFGSLDCPRDVESR